MQDVQHILVPTDGSADSLAAASFAGILARALGARVTVLMVQDENSVVPQAWNAALAPVKEGASADEIEQVRSSIEKNAAEGELAATRAAVGQIERDIKLAQTWGHPSSEICRYAEDNAVDLIVMGSHGRTGIKRVLLGSVSHAVANGAPCAVTVVR